jgi:hypothetical protein
MGTNVHHDKNRRKARNRQCHNDPLKGIKTPGRSRNNHDAVHNTALTHYTQRGFLSALIKTTGRLVLTA